MYVFTSSSNVVLLSNLLSNNSRSINMVGEYDDAKMHAMDGSKGASESSSRDR